MTITSENQSYLSPRNTQKTQKKYDSESVIKDFRVFRGLRQSQKDVGFRSSTQPDFEEAIT